MTIYLADYMRQPPRRIKEWCSAHNAVLVDVRGRANSKDRRWAKKALVETFGGTYTHLPKLGADSCVNEETKTGKLRSILTNSNAVVIYSARLVDRVALGERLHDLTGVMVSVLVMEEQAIDSPMALTDNGFLSIDGVILDIDQAKSYLDMTDSTFKYHLHVSKHLRPYGKQIGRTWIFTQDALDKYLEFSESNFR
jgi:hypothetical protein